MNKKFMIHNITIYHILDSEIVTKINFNGVYFRHNKSTKVIDKGVEKGSVGTIYIPTTKKLEIFENDIVVEMFSDNNSISEKNVYDEYKTILRNNDIQKFRVISVDDNRKGNLQHFKLSVGE